MGSLGSLGSLNVLLSANTAQFSSAMDKAAFTAERNLQKISSKTRMNSAIITAALLAAATAIAVSIKKTVDRADEIGDKMAPALGMATEELSRLEYAAKISGVEIGNLRSAFQRFNRTVFDETNGILVNNISTFNALGIALKDTDGKLKSNYTLTLEVADALSSMENGLQKSALAQTLFGKSGSLMVPLLNAGSEGIKKLGEEAEALGIVFDEKTAKASAQFNDNMTRMSSVTQGLMTKFTAGFIPTMANFTEGVTGSAAALENFEKSGKNTATVLVAMIGGFSVINGVMKATGILIGSISAAMMGDFKDAGIIIKGMVKDLDNVWTDLTEKLEKNWNAVSDTVNKGASAAEKKASQARVALEKLERKQNEGTTLTNSLRTAQEKYNDELERYQDLLESNAISQETFDRAAQKAKETLDKEGQSTKNLSKAAKDLGFTFQSAFEDSIIEGKKLGEVLSSLYKDIQRIILRNAVTAPLASAISAGVSSLFSSPSPSVASAQGNVFSGNRLIPFAKGGLITSPTIFPLANGRTGLAGEERTEAILPLFRTSGGDLGVKSGGGSGGIEINVYAPEGSKVSQNNKSIGDKEQINIMIDEAVAGSVGNTGSKTYRALRQSFGLKQTLTVR